jgi:hypothetical protein
MFFFSQFSSPALWSGWRQTHSITVGLGEDAEGLKSECVEKLKFNFTRFPCGEVYDLFDRSMSMELHKIYRRKKVENSCRIVVMATGDFPARRFFQSLSGVMECYAHFVRTPPGFVT